jgi:hypothetical protein
VHETTQTTPFELLFGRKPTIPIDILLPNTELHQRESILTQMVAKDNDLVKITILDDIEEEFFVNRMPEIAKRYLENLKIICKRVSE